MPLFGKTRAKLRAKQAQKRLKKAGVSVPNVGAEGIQNASWSKTLTAKDLKGKFWTYEFLYNKMEELENSTDPNDKRLYKLLAAEIQERRRKTVDP